MQLEATLNLEELTAAEVAQFQLKCRKLRCTPEKKAADLIRSFNGSKPARPAKRKARAA